MLSVVATLLTVGGTGGDGVVVPDEDAILAKNRKFTHVFQT